MLRMWRAYDLRYIPSDSDTPVFGLTGAYKTDPWMRGTLTANCSSHAEEDFEEVIKLEPEPDFTTLVTNLYVGSMIKPAADAQRPRRASFDQSRKAYERQCEQHLAADTCSCGIWGYKEAEDLRNYGGYLPPYWTDDSQVSCSHQYQTNYAYSTQVVLLVSCVVYGKVIEGERGFRAQYADIDRIYLPLPPCKENLPPRYAMWASAIGKDKHGTQMHFQCTHPTVNKYDTEIPADPYKIATYLQDQFDAPAIVATPTSIMDNVVKDMN